MELPPDGDDIGWFRWGVAPGADEGSAVLAGHVDTVAEGPGALAPLRRAEIGDEITITRRASSAVRFRVVAKQRVPRASLPTGELFRKDGPPVLTVITCGGRYLPGQGYEDNVVVSAVRA